MSEMKSWQLLFVDDEEDFHRQVKELLEAVVLIENGQTINIQVDTTSSFDHALALLESHRFDMLILDVRLGSGKGEREDEAGISTLKAIKQKCFIPVVFYTALAHKVRNLEGPLIRVVEKTESERLPEVVKEVFATRLPAINRALIKLLETVQRDYLWDFVSQHWNAFSDISDHAGLAYLIARRLALSLSLSGNGIRQLFQDLGDPEGAILSTDRVHPIRYYVIPPVVPNSLAGDLYEDQAENQHQYFMVLTPACDLYTNETRQMKAESIILARCKLLDDLQEYQTWRDNSSNSARNAFLALVEYRKDRYYFLPQAPTIPNLVVDFEQLVAFSREQFGSLRRIASLDSPFAEAVVSRFIRYFGRLGTPDLDLNKVFPGLRQYNG